MKGAREARGLSQERAAKEIGVSRQALAQWEDGQTFPSRKRTLRIAQVYGISASSLDPVEFGSVGAVDLGTEAHTISVIKINDLPPEAEGPDDMPALLSALGAAQLAVNAELRYCYAVEVTDDSMAPEYVPGDICIIDPRIAAASGDDVIASLSRTSVVLRRLKERGISSSGAQVFDLYTPNPDHVTVTINGDNPAQILGVVVETRRPKRRR